GTRGRAGSPPGAVSPRSERLKAAVRAVLWSGIGDERAGSGGAPERVPPGSVVGQVTGQRRRSLPGQRLQRRVEQVLAVELGAVSRLLSGDRQQPRTKWLVPFRRERGDIAEDARKLRFADRSGKRNGVESGSADRGIREQRVDAVAARRPAIGQALV